MVPLAARAARWWALIFARKGGTVGWPEGGAEDDGGKAGGREDSEGIIVPLYCREGGGGGS